jgi:hypothetical protein
MPLPPARQAQVFGMVGNPLPTSFPRGFSGTEGSSSGTRGFPGPGLRGRQGRCSAIAVRKVALALGAVKPYGRRMADLMAIFEFQVPGLWLDQGLVGQRLQMPNGVGWIQFPSDDEHLVRSGHKMLFHTSDLISGYNEVLGEKVTLEINAVVLALPCQLTGTLPVS